MKKLTTIVNYILDNTGSMQPIKDSTINGFNEYIQTLKKKKNGKVLFSLTKFNSYGIEKPYVAVDLEKVEKLDSNTYKPDGMTPLYDACVETIEAVAGEINGKNGPVAILTVIMTDGEENASQKHTEKCLSNLIAKLQKQGNWTFVFLGANQDAWAKAAGMGISMDNALNWQATRAGTTSVFASVAAGSVNYMSSMQDNNVKGVALNTSKFFNKKGADENVA